MSSSSSAVPLMHPLHPVPTQLPPKRTRKRFTHEQLIILESTYRKSSHPSRDVRLAAAKETGMDIKSVTIWFQNKRQTDRRNALSNATNRGTSTPPFAVHQIRNPVRSQRTEESGAFPRPPRAVPRESRALSRTLSTPISLDHIARRAEERVNPPRAPRLGRYHTCPDIKRGPISCDAIWETIPSSPLQQGSDAGRISQSDSPSTREFLDFTAAHRGSKDKPPYSWYTLEWACAAARMSGKKEVVSPLLLPRSQLALPLDDEETTKFSDDKTEYADTEVESVNDGHEAITPDTSQIIISSPPDYIINGEISIKEEEPDSSDLKGPPRTADLEQMLDAAWVLCGLGGKRNRFRQKDVWKHEPEENAQDY